MATEIFHDEGSDDSCDDTLHLPLSPDEKRGLQELDDLAALSEIDSGGHDDDYNNESGNSNNGIEIGVFKDETAIPEDDDEDDDAPGVDKPTPDAAAAPTTTRSLYKKKRMDKNGCVRLTESVGPSQVDYKLLTVSIILFLFVAAIGVGIGVGMNRTTTTATTTATTTTNGDLNQTVTTTDEQTAAPMEDDVVEDPSSSSSSSSGSPFVDCTKSPRTFETGALILTLSIVDDNPQQLARNNDPSSSSLTITEAPDHLQYAARVFQKTYSAFSKRAAVMDGNGCDPYCRQVLDIELEGFVYGALPSPQENEDVVKEDNGGNCIEVHLVFTASGTYWTGCDAKSNEDVNGGDADDKWPGLFGQDVSVTEGRTDVDRRGWTRRHLSSSAVDVMVDRIRNELNSSGDGSLGQSKPSHHQNHLRHPRRQLQEEAPAELSCPVCPEGSVSSFSGDDLVAVMDRFVNVLPEICSLVSVTEGTTNGQADSLLLQSRAGGNGWSSNFGD